VLTDRIATEETPMEFIVWVETRLADKTLAVGRLQNSIVAPVESHPRRSGLLFRRVKLS
jgi:hypothetical protein